MVLEFPSTKATKDSIRNAIGQVVTFIIQGDATPCPTCSGLEMYDGVNETSLIIDCGTCSGLYWITDDTVSGIIGHVRWKNMQDTLSRGSVGSTLNGECVITIDIDKLTSSQVTNIKDIQVDDRKMLNYENIYKGIPNRDRIEFHCKEYNKV